MTGPTDHLLSSFTIYQEFHLISPCPITLLKIYSRNLQLTTLYTWIEICDLLANFTLYCKCKPLSLQFLFFSTRWLASKLLKQILMAKLYLNKYTTFSHDLCSGLSVLLLEIIYCWARNRLEMSEVFQIFSPYFLAAIILSYLLDKSYFFFGEF